MFQTFLALQQGLILPPEFVCFILSGPLPVLFVSPVSSYLSDLFLGFVL